MEMYEISGEIRFVEVELVWPRRKFPFGGDSH